ncbi:hypothetical protein PUR34_41360 [Streptomyces sp. JV185]|uniref:hypothetical protein n=1 Tax=Streptomyces sp. JV185 TaxID=858638 RepID=UPI002E770C5C|nr:hypothetical protein [Streptomyces sp. JV185]MEE1774453.1 hypothetical protein [Streptomyces sp. JV185]
MACSSCGGRSGGRATGRAAGIVWRHTDPHGGRVDYPTQERAEIALNARGGVIQQVDARTGAPIQPSPTTA